MAEISGTLESFSVDPHRYAPLERFCCGRRARRAEVEVHGIVSDFYTGKRGEATFRVTVERPNADLVGVAAFHPANWGHPTLRDLNGFPYISVIGLSEAYRGRRKNGRRIGDHLLEDALDQIALRAAGMPVYALIDPSNRDSCNLFERAGFRVVIAADPYKPDDDSLYGLAPGRLDRGAREV
jgi:ribosomal protein S18 acetylase RimI-like enzyme